MLSTMFPVKFPERRTYVLYDSALTRQVSGLGLRYVALRLTDAAVRFGIQKCILISTLLSDVVCSLQLTDEIPVQLLADRSSFRSRPAGSELISLRAIIVFDQ